jgi:hypothetical protein
MANGSTINKIKEMAQGVDVQTWLRLISGIARQIPIEHAELAGSLGVVAADLIASESARQGKTADQIIEGIGLMGAENEKMLIADIARLKAELGETEQRE